MSEGDAVAAGRLVNSAQRRADPTDDSRTVLGQLMTEHGDAIYGFCVRILRDQALAQDVLQQVFVEAYRDLHRFEGRATIKTWLFAIAGHRCQDAIKARRRRDARFQTDEQAVAHAVDPNPDATARIDRARALVALEDCIHALSAESRTAVLLRFQGEMSFEEMATALRVKADTLHARVARAIPLLRRCLEAKGWPGA